MPQSLGGSLIGLALGAYGKKTAVPKLPEINPAQVQKDTVAGNLAVLPQSRALAQAINISNADQFSVVLNRLFPGQLDQVNSIVKSELRGEVPQDVLSQTINQTNAQAASLGLQGSQFQVGLTGNAFFNQSTAIQQRGLQHFGALAAMRPQQFDVTSMFLSSQQRLGFAVSDRTQRFQHDLLSAQVAAAPNPSDVALAQGFDSLFNTIETTAISLAGSALGGGLGGGEGEDKRRPNYINSWNNDSITYPGTEFDVEKYMQRFPGAG